MSLQLKTLNIVCSQAELGMIPGGKVLINTINAHSYNTAQKDETFAEALSKGDFLIPDGASIVKACRWLKAKSQPKERIAGWDLFAFEMRRLNDKGKMINEKLRVMFLGSSEKVLALIRERAAIDYPHLEVITYSPPFKPEFSNDTGHQQGQSRPAMDRHDGTQTGEMDLPALEGIGYSLSCGRHRCGVRLLCRNGGKGSLVVAETLDGMALQVAF